MDIKKYLKTGSIASPQSHGPAPEFDFFVVFAAPRAVHIPYIDADYGQGGANKIRQTFVINL